MSGILTAVIEMPGILLKVGNVREKILSGKSGLKLFIVSCIIICLCVFVLFCLEYLCTQDTTAVAFLTKSV